MKTKYTNENTMSQQERDNFIFQIGTIRQEAHLSARALSLLIDKNEGYINRLETSKDFLPSMEIFMKILKECKTTPEKFFYHNPNEFESDMKILEIFKHLSSQKREALITLLQQN